MAQEWLARSGDAIPVLSCDIADIRNNGSTHKNPLAVTASLSEQVNNRQICRAEFIRPAMFYRHLLAE